MKIINPGYIIQMVGLSKAKYYELSIYAANLRNIYMSPMDTNTSNTTRIVSSTTNNDMLFFPMILTNASTTSHCNSPLFVTDTTKVVNI